MKETEKAEVVALGGLYVIGTNKHESQRIDLQLRGRAGRQGDPGSSRFFISLEDDLCLKYHLKDLISNNWLVANQEGGLDHPGVRNKINRLQRIIEGQNLEIKKTLFKYSTLIEQQRRIMFIKREEILNPASSIGESFGSEEFNPSLKFFKDLAPEKFQEYRSITGIETLQNLCQKIFVGVIDNSWSKYLADIEGFREGIHLLRFGGKNPYFEFLKLAVARFSDLEKEMKDQAIQIFTNMRISGKNLEGPILKTPSATWTYLINDDPMGIGLLGPFGWH
jgi:preprotein translocase subunit SecA